MGVNAFADPRQKRMLLAMAAVTLGLLGWRAWTDRPSARGGLRVEISGATAVREGTHAQVTLTGTFSQSADTPLRLEPPLVRLLNSRGESLPVYLGPFLDEPVLPGRGPVTLSLHYQVPAADLDDALTLDAGGKRVPVKIATDGP